MLGTPAFMAPEQARGHQSEVDRRSDLWSVGATLYALLAGRYVHPCPSADETLVAAATQRAPSLALAWPDLPAALVAAVDRALAFEKAERFADAAAMRRALRDAHAAAPPPRAGRSRSSPRLVPDAAGGGDGGHGSDASASSRTWSKATRVDTVDTGAVTLADPERDLAGRKRHLTAGPRHPEADAASEAGRPARGAGRGVSATATPAVGVAPSRTRPTGALRTSAKATPRPLMAGARSLGECRCRGRASRCEAARFIDGTRGGGT